MLKHGGISGRSASAGTAVCKARTRAGERRDAPPTRRWGGGRPDAGGNPGRTRVRGASPSGFRSLIRHATIRPAIRSMRACWILLLSLASPAISLASHDPNRTVTVYVHGFERTGADRHGIYGDDIQDAVADSVAALIGLPVSEVMGALPPNAVLGTTYYGDTPPSYYTAADRAELGAVTAQWGRGV